MRPSQLVIPCYNESKRLDPAKVAAVISAPDVGVVLVDDGSKDDTISLLKRIQSEHPDAVTVLPMPKNVGKGEAVRAGIQHAIDTGASVVGYADADFSTPPGELLRLLGIMQVAAHEAVFGVRFARLGAKILRKPHRHYLGRVFATFAAITLGAMVYDTQCGAKWFRVSDGVKRAFSLPFTTRWAFDVELIGRLMGRFGDVTSRIDMARVIEIPLLFWEDVGGSKLSFAAMGKAFLDLMMLLAKAR